MKAFPSVKSGLCLCLIAVLLEITQLSPSSSFSSSAGSTTTCEAAAAAFVSSSSLSVSTSEGHCPSASFVVSGGGSSSGCSTTKSQSRVLPVLPGTATRSAPNTARLLLLQHSPSQTQAYARIRTQAYTAAAAADSVSREWFLDSTSTETEGKIELLHSESQSIRASDDCKRRSVSQWSLPIDMHQQQQPLRRGIRAFMRRFLASSFIALWIWHHPLPPPSPNTAHAATSVPVPAMLLRRMIRSDSNHHNHNKVLSLSAPSSWSSLLSRSRPAGKSQKALSMRRRWTLYPGTTGSAIASTTTQSTSAVAAATTAATATAAVAAVSGSVAWNHYHSHTTHLQMQQQQQQYDEEDQRKESVRHSLLRRRLIMAAQEARRQWCRIFGFLLPRPRGTSTTMRLLKQHRFSRPRRSSLKSFFLSFFTPFRRTQSYPNNTNRSRIQLPTSSSSSSSSVAVSNSSERAAQQQREHAYVQDLLHRVKQNSAAGPAMRRTTTTAIATSTATTELQIPPPIIPPPRQDHTHHHHHRHSVVQNLKSLKFPFSTRSTESESEPLFDLSPFQPVSEIAEEAATVKATTRTTGPPLTSTLKSSMFLHEIDALFAIVFPSTADPATAMFSTDELSESVRTTGSPFLHELDQVFTTVFNQAIASIPNVNVAQSNSSEIYSDRSSDEDTHSTTATISDAASVSVAPTEPKPIPRSSTNNSPIRVLESLESLIEQSKDANIRSAAEMVLTEVEAASDLVDQLKTARSKIVDTTATIDVVEENQETEKEETEKEEKDIQLTQAILEPALDEGSSGSVLPSIQMTDSQESRVDLPNDPGSVSTAAADILVEAEVNGKSSSPEDADDSMEIALNSNEEETTPTPIVSPGNDALNEEETVVSATSWESSDKDPEMLYEPVVPEALLDSQVSLQRDEERIVAGKPSISRQNSFMTESYPALIRERMRTKRHQQQLHDHAKKEMKDNLDSKLHELSKPVNVFTIDSVSSLEHKDKAKASSDEALPRPISVVTSKTEETLLQREATHMHTIPNLSFTNKKHYSMRSRHPLRSPAEDAALARKYAAISSLEERAYAVLKDLGMFESDDDDVGL